MPRSAADRRSLQTVSALRVRGGARARAEAPSYAWCGGTRAELSGEEVSRPGGHDAIGDATRRGLGAVPAAGRALVLLSRGGVWTRRRSRHHARAPNPTEVAPGRPEGLPAAAWRASTRSPRFPSGCSRDASRPCLLPRSPPSTGRSLCARPDLAEARAHLGEQRRAPRARPRSRALAAQARTAGSSSPGAPGAGAARGCAPAARRAARARTTPRARAARRRCARTARRAAPASAVCAEGDGRRERGPERERLTVEGRHALLRREPAVEQQLDADVADRARGAAAQTRVARARASPRRRATGSARRDGRPRPSRSGSGGRRRWSRARRAATRRPAMAARSGSIAPNTKAASARVSAARQPWPKKFTAAVSQAPQRHGARVGA